MNYINLDKQKYRILLRAVMLGHFRLMWILLLSFAPSSKAWSQAPKSNAKDLTKSPKKPAKDGVKEEEKEELKTDEKGEIPEKRESYRNENVSVSTKPSGTGFSLYGGFDLGFATTTPKNSELESPKKGFIYGGKILGTVFTNDMAGDLGIGYMRSSLTGDKDYTENKDTAELTEFGNVTVLTNAAYAEFSPRVRLGNHFQLGPLGQVFFGTDASFGAQDHETSSTALAGVQLLYNTGDDFLFRAGVQILTDINIYARQLYLGLLTIQFGVPVVKQKTIVKTIEDVTTREREKVKKIIKNVRKQRVVEVVKILFDSETVHFVTNSAQLSEKSASFLDSLGRFLANNPEEWKFIRVEGHTDKRGTVEHNMKLSQARAESVRAALISAGISEDKIAAKGFGFHQPLSKEEDPVSLAKNRRVEMNFEGVRNTELIGQTINSIRAQYK